MSLMIDAKKRKWTILLTQYLVGYKILQKLFCPQKKKKKYILLYIVFRISGDKCKPNWIFIRTFTKNRGKGFINSN